MSGRKIGGWLDRQAEVAAGATSWRFRCGAQRARIFFQPFRAVVASRKMSRYPSVSMRSSDVSEGFSFYKIDVEQPLAGVLALAFGLSVPAVTRPLYMTLKGLPSPCFA